MGNDLSELTSQISELKEKEIRWQETSIKQLSFFNNLLIVLGTGFLSISFNADEILSFDSLSGEWRPTLLVISISCMGASLLLGLIAGFNRLYDFRYTHLVNRFYRKLYEVTHKHFSYPINDKNIKTRFLAYYWLEHESLLEISPNEYLNNSENVQLKINLLRKVERKLGKLTRRLMLYQWAFFLSSILTYVISLIH